MDKSKAYAIVLNDILEKGCGPMVGKYDAAHGDKPFMYGVASVMEYIAYNVNKDIGRKFEELFLENMIKSEESKNLIF